VAEHQRAFDLIKYYISSVTVLKAPEIGFSFRLYIVAEDKVIGVIHTQVNVETRYYFIEK
jgi:hypothetical protein